MPSEGLSLRKMAAGGDLLSALASMIRLKEPLGHRPRTVLTVIGARSGSSALAGTLGLLGCALPKNLMAANWANTKGYFEPKDLAHLHNELLASVGSTWSDWREFPTSWFGSVEAGRWRGRLAETFLANYGDASLAVLKEPRMSRVLPLWDGVFEDLRARPVFCFIDRNPLEVAASLQARDGSSMAQGLLYYIRNHLDAEFATRNRCRAFVSYHALLADWRRTIGFVSEKLRVDFEASADEQSQVDTFMEPGLRHHETRATHHSPGDLPTTALDVHDAFTQLSTGRSERRTRCRLDKLRATFNAWHEAPLDYGL